MATEESRAAGRISVVRGRHLVPLLAGAESSAGKEQPWRGVLLERHRVQPSEIPEHEHPDLCLHLQVAGEDDFEWWSEGRSRVERTRPGALILIPPGTRDRLRWQGPSQRIIVSVDEGRLRELARELGVKEPPAFRAAWALQAPGLQSLMSEMGREAAGGWPLGSLYADLLAVGLQERLLASYATNPVPLRPVKGGLGLPKLRRAMEYLNARMAEDVHLDEVAEELDLSGSHFAHEFRNSTGQTPYQYLLDQRMTKARELLRQTRLPVQFVAAQTGFRSPANFVRAFRQRVGQTPEAWRQEVTGAAQRR